MVPVRRHVAQVLQRLLLHRLDLGLGAHQASLQLRVRRGGVGGGARGGALGAFARRLGARHGGLRGAHSVARLLLQVAQRRLQRLDARVAIRRRRRRLRRRAGRFVRERRVPTLGVRQLGANGILARARRRRRLAARGGGALLRAPRARGGILGGGARAEHNLLGALQARGSLHRERRVRSRRLARASQIGAHRVQLALLVAHFELKGARRVPAGGARGVGRVHRATHLRQLSLGGADARAALLSRQSRATLHVAKLRLERRRFLRVGAGGNVAGDGETLLRLLQLALERGDARAAVGRRQVRAALHVLQLRLDRVRASLAVGGRGRTGGDGSSARVVPPRAALRRHPRQLGAHALELRLGFADARAALLGGERGLALDILKLGGEQTFRARAPLALDDALQALDLHERGPPLLDFALQRRDPRRARLRRQRRLLFDLRQVALGGRRAAGRLLQSLLGARLAVPQTQLHVLHL